ncbi:PREDICTED: protein MIZU-KUSSEI 1 [Ipomoea nil]|uniref:protein MIZU-KUSSEI 1 n=1 Tax=Ipomoea nil TaxID=35883 RepID=UPI000901FFC3|nr:PREDICTED: protein MIZU-KUSSEI 1 [Ipomoea nil]
MEEAATGEPSRLSTDSISSVASKRPPSPPPSSLVEPSVSKKKGNKPEKVFRVVRSVFRSFPIITHPAVCRFPTLPNGSRFQEGSRSGARVTGTLFGYRKGRVSLSVQENPGTLPNLVVELAMQTQALQKEMSQGMVRIALECEKRTEKDKMKLLDEPVWSMFCNGKKIGYSKKRDATDEDLSVMEALKVVSMGAGVLPSTKPDSEGPDAEIAYVRACFDRTVGSKDSETLYMVSPDGDAGPELSIFFVRL